MLLIFLFGAEWILPRNINPQNLSCMMRFSHNNITAVSQSACPSVCSRLKYLNKCAIKPCTDIHFWTWQLSDTITYTQLYMWIKKNSLTCTMICVLLSRCYHANSQCKNNMVVMVNLNILASAVLSMLSYPCWEFFIHSPIIKSGVSQITSMCVLKPQW